MKAPWLSRHETGATKAEQPGEEAGVQWRRYARTLLVTCAAQLAAAALLVLAANPYGNLPLSLFRQHVIMDANQRYQYPAIARSGQFDSVVIGTSTSRLLRPGALNQNFGGRFANLAMDSATAWEQYRVGKLFAAAVSRPRTLLVGLDHVWCRADAAEIPITKRGFPEWMFDADPWNDLAFTLNKTTLKISLRRFAFALGRKRESIAFDGYGIFVPPEETYDLAKARANIHQGMETASIAAPAASPSAEQRASWSFPALAWLEELLKERWERVVLIITPVHVAAMPHGIDALREDECKARLARLADRYNAPLVDFRIASEITTHDENYWDNLHYRVPIAERIVSAAQQAVLSRKDDPGGTWRVLAGSR